MSVAKGLAYVTAFVENRAYREAGITPPSDLKWMDSACRSVFASYAPTRPGHWRGLGDSAVPAQRLGAKPLSIALASG
jgi:hypothetical protein